VGQREQGGRPQRATLNAKARLDPDVDKIERGELGPAIPTGTGGEAPKTGKKRDGCRGVPAKRPKRPEWVGERRRTGIGTVVPAIVGRARRPDRQGVTARL